jgi:hypothetical protein
MMRARRRQILLALLPGMLLATNAQARGRRGTVRLYRANGRYAGRIEANGRYYGDNGRYLGRVEGQRIYSAQGRYLGRFEESGAFHDAPGLPGGADRSGHAGADDRDRDRDLDIALVQPSIAHEVSPLPPEAVVRPPPAFGADPTTGQPIIEIIRPARGTR